MNQQTVDQAISEAFEQVIGREIGGERKILLLEIPEDFDHEALLKKWTKCMRSGVGVMIYKSSDPLPKYIQS